MLEGIHSPIGGSVQGCARLAPPVRAERSTPAHSTHQRARRAPLCSHGRKLCDLEIPTRKEPSSREFKHLPHRQPRPQAEALARAAARASASEVIGAHSRHMGHGLGHDPLAGGSEEDRAQELLNYPASDRNIIAELRQKFHDSREDYLSTPEGREAPEDAVCRAMLTARLPHLALCRCCVGKSKFAGRGLFVTTDLAAGELISLYPGDALLYYADGNRSSAAHAAVVFGAHVAADERDAARVRTDDARAYEIAISATLSLVGDPGRCDDAAYLAHMCNDGDMCSAQDEAARYQRTSAAAANAEFVELEGCHFALASTRPIASGEEVFVSYGAGYWISRSKAHSAPPTQSIPNAPAASPSSPPDAADSKAYRGVRIRGKKRVSGDGRSLEAAASEDGSLGASRGYEALIRWDQQERHLGWFATAEQAALAYARARRERHKAGLEPSDETCALPVRATRERTDETCARVPQADQPAEEPREALGGCVERATRRGSAHGFDEWLEEWHERFICWFSSVAPPMQERLGDCLGALGLVVGERLERRVRRVPKAPTNVATNVAKGCEWISEQYDALGLPEFPSTGEGGLVGEPLQLTPLAIPRLLPKWERLQALTQRSSQPQPTLTQRAGATGTAATFRGLGIGLAGAGGAMLAVSTWLLASRCLRLSRRLRKRRSGVRTCTTFQQISK